MKTINKQEKWSSDRIKELTMSRISHDKNSSNIQSKTIRKMSIIAIAAAVIAVSGLGVYAAVTYLTPSEVATELDYPKLAEQFEIQTSLTEEGVTGTTAAAVIAEPISVTSGDYTFTFLGLTSGEDLTEQFDEAEDGSTYAILAISKADGTLFDSDSYYEDMTSDRFFVSPLIHGIAPWQGGATVMNGGGYTERIIDGVLYRIMNCDNIEIFADTGVSLAASTGVFFDTKAFAYDDVTGKTTVRSDFDGSAVIFELPFDKSLGDPVKAVRYWEEFESEANESEEMPEPPRIPEGETDISVEPSDAFVMIVSE